MSDKTFSKGNTELSSHQIRALVYMGLMILIAFDWTAIGAGLFLALMQFVEG